MKILLVDDDPAGLEIRRLILERHGFDVAAAADASSARAAFAAHAPDAVVMDLRLPDISDGLTLLGEFRHTRIIVLCGNRADLDGRDEASLPAVILQKPVRSEELIRAIRGA
jgi:two-component system KDP operon response regulator KdpE